MLPSGDSQMRGGNSETGGRHDSPRKQEKPHTILQVINKLNVLFHRGQKHTALYDQKEYERGVKAVMKGKFLVKSTHEAIEMLIDQQTLLGSIPLDAMRNNSNKLVNQDMDVAPLEEMNLYAECILRQVAENMHDSKLMSRYVEELTKKEEAEVTPIGSPASKSSVKKRKAKPASRFFLHRNSNQMSWTVGDNYNDEIFMSDASSSGDTIRAFISSTEELAISLSVTLYSPSVQRITASSLINS